MASVNDNSVLKSKLAPAADMGKPATTGGMKAVLNMMMSQISMALPAHLKNNADRYARQLITLHSSNRYLQRCSLGSQLAALMTAAALGLELTPSLGLCYIIPYKDKAQFQLGYRGAIKLANQSGQIKRIFADVVYEKDQFEYSLGLDDKLIHNRAACKDRGEISFVYALAKFVNGGYAFDVWTREEVEKHARKFSQAYSQGRSTPWITDWEAMAKKTLIMAIWKYLPISTDVQMGFAADGAVRTISSDSDMEREAEVLDLTEVAEVAELAEPEIPKIVAPVAHEQGSMMEKVAELKKNSETEGEVFAKSYRTGRAKNPALKETDQDEPNAPLSDENGAV